MNNLKINTKFLISFGIVLVLMVIMGLTSIISLGNLNKIINTYKLSSLPNTEHIWMIRRNMISIQRYLLMALVDGNSDTINHCIETITTESEDLMKYISIYKKDMQVDKSIIEQVEKDINDNDTYKQQIVDLARQNTEEANAKAYEIFTTEYKANFDSAAAKLIDLSDKQNEIITDLNETARNTAINAFMVVAVVIISSFIVTIILVLALKKLIVTPITELEKAAVEISNGNLSVNLRVNSTDEIGMLTGSFLKVSNIFKYMIGSINALVSSFQAGDIDSRIVDSEFSGEFKSTVSSINLMAETLIADTLTILESFGKLGDGDFSVNMRKFPGKKSIANEKFESVKNNLASVNGDISGLIENAINGQLDIRVNTELYQGDWKTLTEGLNKLLYAVSEPINSANQILHEISQGNFDISVSHVYKGSFETMMQSFDTMIATIGSYISEITDVLGTMAAGELTKDIKREYIGQFNLIKESIHNISATLRDTISEIKASADNVLLGSKQISEAAMDLANGTTNQASSIEELNASINNINDQTQINAVKAKDADEMSQKSIIRAKHGNEEMLKMLQSMEDIRIASNDISKIINVIDSITFQTNLLAINASVEAAHAGQHGKGFTVVADEVRSLADKTQKAAKQTSDLIESTIAKIEEGTEIAKVTAAALQDIVDGTDSVSKIINGIYTSTKEQAESIGQITIGINQISNVIQNNSSMSEESAAAAQELNSQSEVLAQMVKGFVV